MTDERIPGQATRGVQAVAFDMDGLLVDTEPVWWRAEREIAEALGGSWTDEDSVSCVGGPMEKVADIIIASAGGGDRRSIIEAVIDRVAELLHHHPVVWLPGARELLLELDGLGIPFALVSASPRKVVSAVLAALGDDATRFAFTISADDVAATKPDPEPYLEAARRFGCAPADLVVFEDSPTGTTSAVASGAFVFAVPHVGGIIAAPRLRVLGSLAGVTAADVVAMRDAVVPTVRG